MEFIQKEKDGFSNAVESLKKYRRADLIDEQGRSLLKDLYTDPLPNEHILKKCLNDNTTFLIGRKGTGKSTIFLRIEQKIRNRKDYISCYLDVKTIYESSATQSTQLDYLNDLLPKEVLTKYLIERSFIQSVLYEIQKEILKKTDTFLTNLAKRIGAKLKPEIVKDKMKGLEQKIKNNEVLQKIEVPTLQKVTVDDKTKREDTSEKKRQLSGVEINVALKPDAIGGGLKTDSGIGSSYTNKNVFEIERKFSDIFLRVFQIKEIIIEIKEILRILKIKHLIILLDDFSEIDDYAIKTFVDVILAPLNNWSEEFIKFKIAAYPHRIYYGKIDPGKIDEINLDFYNLYSEFDRDKMEERAIDFTKRLVEKRVIFYTGKNSKYFFGATSDDISDYYELLFQVSMNVPRIIGYILSYCYQNKIVFDKRILKSDIVAASQRYYKEKLEPFFEKTTYSLLSIDEKISIFQLKELLDKIVEDLLDVKKRISTKILKGSNYVAALPYSSHFSFDPKLEDFLKTLELNFFISKYSDLSDKDGNESSIYCINHGLAKKNNLLWGKPKGASHTKYFQQRPFNFNKLITIFLAKAKNIHCTNSECNRKFTLDELPILQKYLHFKCDECGQEVIVEPISKDIKMKLEEIDEGILLPSPELEILNELRKAKKPILAKDIAEEIDCSKQLVAWRCKKLDEELGLVTRERELYSSPFKYELTTKAKAIYFSKI